MTRIHHARTQKGAAERVRKARYIRSKGGKIHLNDVTNKQLNAKYKTYKNK